eukprot:3146223-Pyramimonas_sp.AAC.1
MSSHARLSQSPGTRALRPSACTRLMARGWNRAARVPVPASVRSAKVSHKRGLRVSANGDFDDFVQVMQVRTGRDRQCWTVGHVAHSSLLRISSPVDRICKEAALADGCGKEFIVDRWDRGDGGKYVVTHECPDRAQGKLRPLDLLMNAISCHILPYPAISCPRDTAYANLQNIGLALVSRGGFGITRVLAGGNLLEKDLRRSPPRAPSSGSGERVGRAWEPDPSTSTGELPECSYSVIAAVLCVLKRTLRVTKCDWERVCDAIVWHVCCASHLDMVMFWQVQLLTCKHGCVQAMSSRGRDVDPNGGQMSGSTRTLSPSSGEAYSAAALSLVFHSASPMVPTFRADVRYFQVWCRALPGGG